MAGAGKKRNKAERQSAQKSRDTDNGRAYDGPSERPGSSGGPGQASSSRGRPPSNPSVQANLPSQSVRSSSRPPSAGGPAVGPSRASSRPRTAGGAPLRDPALDPSRPREPALNRNIEWGGNAFNYFSDDTMPRELMKRPGFGKIGNSVKIRLNSHYIQGTPDKIYYQYDVQIGNGAEKRGLIKAVWDSNQLNQAIPGNRNDWIFDGNKLAWSARNLPREFRLEVNLDAERGRPPREDKAPDTCRVVIRAAQTGAKIDLNNIHEYLNGKCSIGPHVFDAINFLDHLVREWPSKNLVSIKRSYFHRHQGDRDLIGGGIEAMRGVYQSIRMAEGKRLVVNVDVSHTTFWHVASFPIIINQLTGHNNVDTLQTSWRGQDGKPNFKFDAMKRLRANNFTVKHKGRSEVESNKIWKVASILPQHSREYKFRPWNKQAKKLELEMSVFDYYHKTYNVYLNMPHLPLVVTGRMIPKRDNAGNIIGKSPIVFPMELCNMCDNQRYPYKLNETQTASMIKFAVKRPGDRLQGINKGISMLNWNNDPYLKHYGLKIEPKQIETNARILPPPKLQFGGSVAEPGTSGRWDLKGKKFISGNTAPLISWGVTVIKSGQFQGKPIQLPQVQAFVKAFVQAYRGHGGTVQNEQPIIQEGHPDVPKAVELLFYAVGNKHNIRPQMLLFILPNKNADVYLRIKKSCDCRWGVQSQCVQGQQAMKVAPQYISNVLMKFNAKLGGTTNRIVTPKNAGHFTKPTMVIGADVSHAAPGVGAPSYAAMTVSMDKFACRYAAGVQTNGFRVEMIATRNLRDMLQPLFRHWTSNVAGGRLPDHIYYFRDGVSEGQYVNVLRNEVADIKEILKEMGETRKDYDPRFTVVVAEKRHHIRFFPGAGKGGDQNQNPLPGTVVDHDVTHPFENDIYLCSHKAIQGTARPTHYHMLMDEAGVPNDEFQKMLYEQCYQYIRSTTPVSLHPAVYYAHLASNRARSHENISEDDRRNRDWADPSKSTSGKPEEEAKALIPMDNVDNISYGMWFV
ncbi:MAG: hypothetical protein Q9170_004627 [Blastenia crenularia]